MVSVLVRVSLHPFHVVIPAIARPGQGDWLPYLLGAGLQC
jgi:hypothetical protein